MAAQDFIDEVRFLLDNRQDLPYTQILRWVNMGYIHVQNPKVYRHMETLSDSVNVTAATTIPPQPVGSVLVPSPANNTLYVGLPIYVLPTVSSSIGIMGVHSVKITQNANPLYYRWPQWRNSMMFDLSFATDYSGMPAFWTHGPGNYIRLRPFPDSTWNGGTILARCWTRQPLLIGATGVAGSGTGTTTVLQDIWDEVIVLRAAYTAWRQLNRPDRAEILKQDFGILANDVASQLALSSEDITETDVKTESPMR